MIETWQGVDDFFVFRNLIIKNGFLSNALYFEFKYPEMLQEFKGRQIPARLVLACIKRGTFGNDMWNLWKMTNSIVFGQLTELICILKMKNEMILV